MIIPPQTMKRGDRSFYEMIDGHYLNAPFRKNDYRGGFVYKPEKGNIILNTFPKCGRRWAVETLQESYQACKGETPDVVFLEKFSMDSILAIHSGIISTHLRLNLLPRREILRTVACLSPITQRIFRYMVPWIELLKSILKLLLMVSTFSKIMTKALGHVSGCSVRYILILRDWCLKLPAFWTKR